MYIFKHGFLIFSDLLSLSKQKTEKNKKQIQYTTWERKTQNPRMMRKESFKDIT